jgi:hypothetical protein
MSGCLRVLALLALGAFSGSACRTGSDGAPAPSSETSSTETSEPAAVVAVPAAVECQRILEQSWTAIQPALSRLRIAPGALERDYLGPLGSGFVEGCAALRPAERRCLARAKSPPRALETCAVNRGRSLADRVQLPSLAAHVTLLDPPPIAPREADQELASLSGEWVNIGADGQPNATWTFLSGARLRVREQKAGAESEETFRVSLPARHRMTLERPGQRKQDIALFRSGGSLYVSRGLSYDVVPLVDRSRLTVRHDTSYVFFGPEGCVVVADSGAVLPASCGFERRPDGSELFAVRCSVAPAPDCSVSYPIVDRHLLHERLASYGRFVRRAGER